MKSVIRSALLFLLLAATAARADSIDDAEAKRRGVPVDQVIAERQRDRALQQVQDLQKQVDSLKAQVAALKRPASNDAPATAPAPTADAQPASETPGTGAPLPSPSSPSSDPSAADDKTVHVSGYTRKDGTYVAPYDRRSPRSK